MEELHGDILVAGLGVSGEAVAMYAAGKAAKGAPVEVTVIDGGDSETLRSRAERLRAAGARVMLSTEAIDGMYDLAVVSPGIPPHSTLLKAVRAVSTQVISEIEFAFRRSTAPWLAVTGTNGKTTVTSLLGHLLVSGGVSARVVGNIGSPATSAVEEVGPTGAFVAEVSSFQLAFVELFHPRVSVLLNITPDHLDWHGGMDAYTADKARIFGRQGSDDTAVIDADDPGAARFIDPVKASGVRVVPVSRRSPAAGADGAWLAEDGMLMAQTLSGPISLIPRDALLVRGDHNVSNALAASAAALAFGVPPDAVRAGLKVFRPIEHRLEPLGDVGGVEYFNDSKATNPDAVIKALSAFSDRPVIVLLGGKNKGNSFAELAGEIGIYGAHAIVFGEAAHEIAAALENEGIAFDVESTLERSVERAIEIAAPGSAVVLSPGCASFDEFTDYVQRGRAFKSYVSRMLVEGV